MITKIITRVLQFTLLTIAFCFISSIRSAAQNVEFDKENFKEQKTEFKEAVNSIKKGDDLFKGGTEQYGLALPYYLKAYGLNPKNALLNFKIGMCYLYTPQKINSLQYLEAAQKLKTEIHPKVHYALGMAYQVSEQWDKAIKEYTTYKKSLSVDELKTEEKEIRKKIDECTNGSEFKRKPAHVLIEPINAVNSPSGDYCPVISADEATMMFTSRREGSTGGLKDNDGGFFEDVYISTQVNGKWLQAYNIGSPINTVEHDAAIGLSNDGQKLLTYKSRNGGDIYISYLSGVTWSKPEPISNVINTDFHESSASFSPDGRKLYFVSDKPLGFGGRDIYVSTLDSKGKKWQEPVNLGAVINTEYDEEGVFMHPDGKTLYFSSKGHKSMGGYDIFKSVWSDSLNAWLTPENLGYPINTPDDDAFFVLSANGKHGYYSSFKLNGMGDKDIYRITFLEDKPVQLSTEDNLLASEAVPVSQTVVEPAVEVSNFLTLVKGIIRDKLTQQPLEANIDIVDNVKNEVVGTFTSNSASGKYLISLPSGKNYGITVKAEGYLFHSENFDIPSSKRYQEIEKNVDMERIAVGSTIVLKNIFFDFDKATLSTSSTAELERLILLLKDIPTMRIEISGHTDNKGTAEYNYKLSQARAKAVVEYLIKKGIAKERLEYKGYGMDQPIAPNTNPDGSDNPDGRAQNRRTEFKVLSK